MVSLENQSPIVEQLSKAIVAHLNQQLKIQLTNKLSTQEALPQNMLIDLTDLIESLTGSTQEIIREKITEWLAKESNSNKPTLPDGNNPENLRKISALTDLLNPQKVSLPSPQLVGKAWYLGVDEQISPLKVILAESDRQAKTLDIYPLYGNEGLGFPEKDLSEETLQTAREQLAGIIVSQSLENNPLVDSRLTQVLLQTGWIQNQSQIIGIKRIIALFLGYIPQMTTSQAALSESFSLILDLAITNTELALVKLPEPVYTLTEDEFAVTSLDYGSHALEQDIFCWLIYPQWRSQVNLPFSQSCFPQPGNPDPLKRQEFAQYLQQYPLGRAFLEAARLSKLILQEQAAFTSELTNQPWGITRSEISDKIIQPFLELIDYQINLLLSQRKITNVGIGQVFVSGETSLAIEYVLSVWLRDKFPQANIAFASHQDSLSSVLLGLVSSPFFPFLTKYAPKKNFH